MNFLGPLLDGEPSAQARFYGLVVGIVTNNKDELGRVKVRFPWLSGSEESHWARVASPMGGKDRGAYFLPEVDDEVLVGFEHGDPRFPYVVGALWNGKDRPPAANGNGRNDVRLIKSRSGHVIKLNDEDGKETIEIVDKTGRNRIVIDTATNSLTIAADRDIKLVAKGAITLQGERIELKSSSSTRIAADGELEAQAKKKLRINGQTVEIN